MTSFPETGPLAPLQEDLRSALRALPSGSRATVHEQFSVLYPLIRRMAHDRLQGQGTETVSEPFGVTFLHTTALVHEAFLRMAGSEPLVRGKESSFWQYASEVMQGIVVEHARKRLDRLDRLAPEAFDLATRDSQQALQEVLRINEAMEVLRASEPELAKVVEMQYFGGFTDEEIAKTFGVSDRTIRRAWVKARGLLQAILNDT